MVRLPWLALVLPLFLAACRKEAAPSSPPLKEGSTQAEAAAMSPSKPSPIPSHPAGCPPIPDWAEDLPGEVFVEVLHLPAKRSGRDGVGYRLFESGRLDTYGTREFYTDENGKIASRKVPGAWSTPGGVSGTKLEEMRKLVRDTQPSELAKWSPKKAPKDADVDVSLFRVRYDEGIASGCYYGDRPPPPLGALERTIHDLRGSLGKAKAEEPPRTP